MLLDSADLEDISVSEWPKERGLEAPSREITDRDPLLKFEDAFSLVRKLGPVIGLDE